MRLEGALGAAFIPALRNTIDQVQSDWVAPEFVPLKNSVRHEIAFGFHAGNREGLHLLCHG